MSGNAIIQGNTSRYYGGGVYLWNGGKKRNSDAGALLDLYAQYSGGVWSYVDTSSGGVGDTTANWQ
jgi:hypothetical protein